MRAYLTAELSIEERGKLKKEIRDFLGGARYSRESILEEREKIKVIQDAVVEKNLAAFIRAVEVWEAKNIGQLGGVGPLAERIKKMLEENHQLFVEMLKAPRARWNEKKDGVETWTEADINEILFVLFPNAKDKLYRCEWRDFRRAAAKQEKLAKLINPDLLISEEKNPYKDFINLFVVFSDRELARLSAVVKSNLLASTAVSGPTQSSCASTLIASNTLINTSSSSSSSSSSAANHWSGSSLHLKGGFVPQDDSDEADDDLDEEQDLKFKSGFRRYSFVDTETYLENLVLLSKEEADKPAHDSSEGDLRPKSSSNKVD